MTQCNDSGFRFRRNPDPEQPSYMDDPARRRPPTPTFCDHYIDFPDDPFAGTYCKLFHGHDGDHSAHYPRTPALPGSES